MKFSIAHAHGARRSATMLRTALASIAGLAVAVSAIAQPRYTVTDLGVLPGMDSSTATSLNNAGQVAGYCAMPDNSFATSKAFVWQNGQLANVGAFAGGHYAAAWGINSSGTITGDGDTGNLLPQAWATSPAGFINLMPNNGGNTRPQCINDAGAICGFYTTSLSGNTRSWKAALWTPDPKSPGRYKTINLPILQAGDPKFAASFPHSMNLAGQMVGDGSTQLFEHAVLWNNDATHTLVDLGAAPNDWQSSANAINDAGQIAGWSNGQAGMTAALWNNDAAHTAASLGTLPGDASSVANAINHYTEVVGQSGNSAATHAFLWSAANGMEDLAALVDASGAGWTLTAATAINDLGQIAGNGIHNGQKHAFLLTPIVQ